jgi:hypothetical protein
MLVDYYNQVKDENKNNVWTNKKVKQTTLHAVGLWKLVAATHTGWQPGQQRIATPSPGNKAGCLGRGKNTMICSRSGSFDQ